MHALSPCPVIPEGEGIYFVIPPPLRRMPEPRAAGSA